MPNPMSKLFYSIPEVVEIIGICRTKIFEEIREGRLVAHKCGRRTLICPTALHAWQERLSTIKPASESYKRGGKNY